MSNTIWLLYVCFENESSSLGAEDTEKNILAAWRERPSQEEVVSVLTCYEEADDIATGVLAEGTWCDPDFLDEYYLKEIKCGVYIDSLDSI